MKFQVKNVDKDKNNNDVLKKENQISFDKSEVEDN